jgi:hypothetical protein
VSIFSPIFERFSQQTAQLALILALFAPAAFAQQTAVAPTAPEPTFSGSDQPLGTVARNSKKPGDTHAKKVITEDNMNAMPLPTLQTDGPENSAEIVAAIGEYKRTHTPEETEAAVRVWFERYDQDLAAAIKHNQVVNSLREENASNGNEMCREGADWQKCEGRRRAEYIGARHDQYTISKNWALETRIQHAFMNVRNGIGRYNLHYDWFRIRTTNGIDTY